MRPYRFQSLLLSLVLVLILAPIFTTVFGAFCLNLFLMILLLSSLYFLSQHTYVLILGIFFAIPAFFFSWAGFFSPSKVYELIDLSCHFLFLMLVLGVLIKKVYLFKEAKTDLLFGAVSIYLLFGLVWGISYQLIELIVPGSFIGIKVEERFYDSFLYYSFVTLTTLGFGDIVPVSSIARVLSFLEAIVGQFYIAILVASLVAIIAYEKRST